MNYCKNVINTNKMYDHWKKADIKALGLQMIGTSILLSADSAMSSTVITSRVKPYR